MFSLSTELITKGKLEIRVVDIDLADKTNFQASLS